MTSDVILGRYQAGGGRRAASSAKGLSAPPSLRTVVVTCMDARIDVSVLFGLNAGETHVLRNAGGVVTDDVIRSLAISQRKLGTRDVLLVQHSGCGMATFTEDEFGEELAAETGMRPPWRTHAFPDVAQSVRRDLVQLRRNPFLHPEMRVRGFVLDIGTFALDEVVPDEVAAGRPLA